MIHLDDEISKLKKDIVEMWSLVISQLDKSKEAITRFDKALAGEVLANEKRVDAFELKLSMDCENILALFNPVANDLRFVLAALKINYNLERVGDYAKGIVKLIKDADTPLDPKSLEEARIFEMFDTCNEMLNNGLTAFSCEDNVMARSIFKRDETLDQINKNANNVVAGMIRNNPAGIHNYLDILSVIRKLERVGDQTKNISEEIIFYMEAKMIRHKKKKKPDEEQL